MGDRMFASEGDSVNVGRLGSTAHADRWEEARPARGGSGGDEATAWMARRLQGRLDRQQWLLDQHLQSDPTVVPELLEINRRMRRDTEVLQMLGGDEPGLRPVAARRLADIVTESVSAADEPSRVAVRSAPAASIAPAASAEFQHVLAAAIDHVTVAYPDARVDLASRVENLGGITIDLAVDGAMRQEPDGLDGRSTHIVAEQLALRSRTAVELRRPAGGPPPSGSGLVLSVHCPATSVTVDEPVWPSTSATGDRFRNRVNGSGAHTPVRGNGFAPAGPPTGPNGFDYLDRATSGYPGEQSGGFYGAPAPGEATGPGRAAAYGGGGYGSDPYGSGSYNGRFDPLNDPLPPSRPSDDAYRGYGDTGYPGQGVSGTGGFRANGYTDGVSGTGGFRSTSNGAGSNGSGYGTNGYGNGDSGYPDNGFGTDATSLTGPSLPAYKPSRSSGVDELFGPLLDLPIEPMDDRFATPIFEAIASVWFRDDAEGDSRSPQEWETPNDAEWRAAAERAVSEPAPESMTATGLPRRRPGGQLVPPPLSGRPAPATGPTERVPDRVRDRLSTYQRGLRQGRHRAPGESSEYGDW